MPKLFLVLLVIGVVGLSARQDPAPTRTLYVDNTGACIDNSTGGSEALPFCSMRYVASIARPGDTFIFSSKRDGSGPAEFTRAGTATAPITYRSTTNTVIGSFVDVKDEDFKATEVPHVFALTGAPTGYVWQTAFDPIVVDDPGNPSIYTMVDTDGPLMLSVAPDDATLAKIEGTYRHGVAGLRVHPFGNRVPGTTATDFVIGTGRSLNFGSKTHYQVLEGFTVTYLGSAYGFMTNGTGSILRNLDLIGVTLMLKGTGHTAENVRVRHVHGRDASGNWLWHYRGVGTAASVDGWNHRMTDIHLFHSWNASVSAERAPGLIIDGLRMHGSPNHCTAAGSNITLRNAVMYNCQDYFYPRSTTNYVVEHAVHPSGIGMEGRTGPFGTITVRNSIMRGSFVWTTASKPEYCQWEQGSLLENNVLDAAATIERCDGTKVPIQTYQENCEAGKYVDANGEPNCMTIRNNRYVTDFRTVITDGIWNATMGDTWNVELVPGSPALDLGLSGTATDILGVPRPQGETCEAGVYEVCSCPQFFRRRPNLHQRSPKRVAPPVYDRQRQGRD